jgi:hypothetical protein
MRLLLVEDDVMVASGIKLGLCRRGLRGRLGGQWRTRPGGCASRGL